MHLVCRMECQTERFRGQRNLLIHFCINTLEHDVQRSLLVSVGRNLEVRRVHYLFEGEAGDCTAFQNLAISSPWGEYCYHRSISGQSSCRLQIGSPWSMLSPGRCDSTASRLQRSEVRLLDHSKPSILSPGRSRI